MDEMHSIVQYSVSQILTIKISMGSVITNYPAFQVAFTGL